MRASSETGICTMPACFLHTTGGNQQTDLPSYGGANMAAIRQSIVRPIVLLKTYSGLHCC